MLPHPNPGSNPCWEGLESCSSPPGDVLELQKWLKTSQGRVSRGDGAAEPLWSRQGWGQAQPRQGSEAALPPLAAGMSMLGSMPVQAEFQLQPAILAHGFVKPGVHR